MSFENDYKAFKKSIFFNDYLKSEEIIAGCDTKSRFLIKAINDFGEIKVRYLVDKFRSIGLKRSLDKILDDYHSLNFDNEYDLKEKTEKITLSHLNNKHKNNLLHLSGSSFKTEKISKVLTA